LAAQAPAWKLYYTDTRGVVPELEVWDAGEDDELIPPREWLLGNAFCLGFLSGLLAPGATGKTALRHAQYLALATGRELTGEHVFRRCRVLIVSLEDDRNELRRRIRAVCIHHNVTQTELKGWLFFSTPKGVKLAQLGKKNTPQRGVLEAMLRTAIDKYQPQLVSLDPFIKLHSLNENDNPAMDFVCDLLIQLASEYNIAVDAPHHTRKGPLSPVMLMPDVVRAQCVIPAGWSIP
jgi:RecA-family ATPase